MNLQTITDTLGVARC